MKDKLKLTLPFSILGIVFILIGLVLNDRLQLEFGVMWLILALAAFVIKTLKSKKSNET